MVKLNDSDRNCLHNVESIMQGLSSFFGPNVEYVLHSLEDLEHSIIAIENGEISGRTIGGAATDLALQFVYNDGKSDLELEKPYYTRQKNGRNSRSVTIPIRNREKLIGLLCINFILDTSIYEWLSFFQEEKEATQKRQMTEIFENDFQSMVKQIIQQEIHKTNNNSAISNNEKNFVIVKGLVERGVFNVKGAVQIVSSELKISIHTVYSYLRSIQDENNTDNTTGV